MSVKRTYTKKTRSSIRQAALDQLRKTRAHIAAQNPGLLNETHRAVQNALHPPAKSTISEEIDRKKNLQAIMLFLQMKKDHSPAFQSTLKQIIKDYQDVE